MCGVHGKLTTHKVGKDSFTQSFIVPRHTFECNSSTTKFLHVDAQMQHPKNRAIYIHTS